MWPPPAAVTQTSATPAAAAAAVEKAPPPEPNYFAKFARESALYTSGLVSLVALGVAAPNNAFAQMLSTFSLAGIAGNFYFHVKFARFCINYYEFNSFNVLCMTLHYTLVPLCITLNPQPVNAAAANRRQ